MRIPKEAMEYFRKAGRIGGKKGGKRSLETMTDEERHARAVKAGLASAAARAKKTR